METTKRILAGALFALCMIVGPRAHAECLTAPPQPQPTSVSDTGTPPQEATGDTRSDVLGRVVAPVMINGQGPFRFIVDTGANRSVLSGEVAARLGLVADGVGEVHSIEGVTAAPLAQVNEISYGRVPLSSGQMPILQSSRMLAGEAGILGVDGMQGRRLRLDFDHHCIEILPSRNAHALHGWVTIQGQLRFGHLVTIPARIRGVTVNVLVDTGSNVSFGNTALRAALTPVAASRDSITSGRAFTASRPIVLDQIVVLPQMMLGDELMVSHITAFIGDFHVFSLWGFEHEPTLLIGMDVLGQTREVAIDYARATVHFRLPPRLSQELDNQRRAVSSGNLMQH
ncbi:MAG TPA: aspartyl protease family protein [Caulobacterales bacterium]|nr:aspartyl protease family protein [Caulobacterales bacterium]